MRYSHEPHSFSVGGKRGVLVTGHEVGAFSVRFWTGLWILLLVWKLLPLRNLLPVPWSKQGWWAWGAIGCRGANLEDKLDEEEEDRRKQGDKRK